jgi:anti-sigma B factor antagonist
VSAAERVLCTERPKLAIEVVREPIRMLVRLSGEFDMAGEDAFREALDVLGEPAEAVLDLTEARFIDSTGLRLILEAHRRLEQLGTAVIVRIPQDGCVPRLLELTGLDAILTVARSGGDPAA